jgi:crossover junction endodeoxyribonuclease RusA
MTAAPLMTLRFALPWPPSVNTYWRHIILGGKHKKARAHTLLSEGGRDYRVKVLAAIREQQVPINALKGRLSAYITAYPPDRRRRDIDNLLKSCLDSLVHAHVIADDGDIDDLHIVRGICIAGGRLDLKLSEVQGVVYSQTTLELALPPSNDSFIRPPF